MGSPPPTYPTSLAHLLAEVARVDLLLRAHALAAPPSAPTPPHRPPPPDEAIYTLLDRPPLAADAQPTPALAEARAEAHRLAAQIAARRAESDRRGVPLRLAMLAERFALDRIDLDLLLSALAPEIDSAHAAFLADLPLAALGRPTAGLAIDAIAPTVEERLAARRRLAHTAPLIRFDLLRLSEDPAAPAAPLPLRALEIDPRIAAFLLGDDTPDARLAPFARALTPAASLADLILPPEITQGLARFLDRDPARDRPPAGAPAPVVYLEGPPGAGKRALAEALCARASLPLLAVDAAALLAAGDDAFARAAPRAAREARLRDAAIHWIGAGPALQPERPIARAALLAALAAHTGLTFLSGSTPWEPAGAIEGRAFVRVELPRPSARDQARLWLIALGQQCGADVDLNALTGMFRLTGGQIQDAAAAARDLARLRDPDAATITMPDLTAACRRRHGRRLGALARLLPPRHGWDDLVLPADRKAILREICAHVRHRGRVLGEWGLDRRLGTGKGLSALFSGPPGTGKTMAAGVIAADLGVALYHIDLSAVVSKYIGETEKHLAELFDDAEAANAALFFDEADALFGKRTEVRDAHDRYANLETSYLLQRIESYEGVVLLASNLLKNIDEAFVRRLAFVVEFPFPGVAERLAIWRGLWAPETPLDQDVDLEFLAARVELAGGYLRNIALAAAYLAAEEGAPIAMRHLLHATRREYQKMGKVVDPGTLTRAR